VYVKFAADDESDGDTIPMKAIRAGRSKKDSDDYG
jgi:hypothetical protein